MKLQAGGHVFDSAIERDRYFELLALQTARPPRIADIEVHPTFEIIPAFTDGAGKAHKATRFTADFRYVELDTGQVVVEDVKPAPTRRVNPRTGRIVTRRAPSATRRDFALRWKLAAYQNPRIRFDIVER